MRIDRHVICSVLIVLGLLGSAQEVAGAGESPSLEEIERAREGMQAYLDEWREEQRGDLQIVGDRILWPHLVGPDEDTNSDLLILLWDDSERRFIPLWRRTTGVLVGSTVALTGRGERLYACISGELERPCQPGEPGCGPSLCHLAELEATVECYSFRMSEDAGELEELAMGYLAESGVTAYDITTGPGGELVGILQWRRPSFENSDEEAVVVVTDDRFSRRKERSLDGGNGFSRVWLWGFDSGVALAWRTTKKESCVGMLNGERDFEYGPTCFPSSGVAGVWTAFSRNGTAFLVGRGYDGEMRVIEVPEDQEYDWLRELLSDMPEWYGPLVVEPFVRESRGDGEEARPSEEE